MHFSITEDWLGDHGVDLDAFMEALAARGIDELPGDNGAWEFDAADDNGDGIPDFLAGLVEDPITTNDSQGGILG